MSPLRLQFEALTASADSSCQTCTKLTISVPSSPSCASAEAAATEQISSPAAEQAALPALLPAVSTTPAAASAAVAAATAGAAATLPAAVDVARLCGVGGLLPLVEVHPTPCLVMSVPLAALQPSTAQSHSAAGIGAGLPRMYADPSSIVVNPQGRTAVPDLCAAGDALEPPIPADGVAAVTALTLHSTSARVRAIRDKQAEKAAKALLEQQSSPKNKKRPAARMAANPTTGHSCSQCGATVRSVHNLSTKAAMNDSVGKNLLGSLFRTQKCHVCDAMSTARLCLAKLICTCEQPAYCMLYVFKQTLIACHRSTCT